MTVDAIRKLRDAEQHGTVQWLACDALIVVSEWRDTEENSDEADAAEANLIAIDNAREAL